jgi:hypothetical protein
MNSKISFSETKVSYKNRAQLESENWQRRGIFTEPRLSELIAFYNELGYEVLVKDCDVSELAEGPCRECFLLFPQRFKVLYTRGEPRCK